MPQAELKAVGGKHDGQTIAIPLEKFLIGRGEDCHLRPNDESVSRHHCVISTDEFCVRVRDLGSTNGTYVNGERIHGQVILSSGDRIEIGDLTFEVAIRETAEGKPASGSADGPIDRSEAVEASPDFHVSEEAAAAKTIVEMPVPGFLSSAANLGETMPLGETSIMESQSADEPSAPVQTETQFAPVSPPTPPPPAQPQQPPAGGPLPVDPQLLQQQLQQLVQQQLQQQLQQPLQAPQEGSTDPTQKPEVAELPPIRLPDPETTGAKDEPPPDAADKTSDEEEASEKPEDDSTSVASEIIKKYMRRRGS